MRALFHDPHGGMHRVVLARHAGPPAYWTFSASGVEVSVAENALRVRSGGWQGAAVHLSWTLPTGEAALTVEGSDGLDQLEDQLSQPLVGELRALRQSQRSRRRRRRAGLAVLATALVLPVLALGWLLVSPGTVLAPLVSTIPTEVDAALGEQVERSVLAKSQKVHDEVLDAAVQRIGARLRAAMPPSPLELRFHVLRAPSINAFAAPGGAVFVHTGLLHAASGPDEVAGVLAHEIGHVVERHGLRQLLHRVGVGAGIGVFLGNADVLVGVAVEFAGHVANLGFSVAQERAADAFALELLRRAEIDPRGLLAFFEAIEATSGAAPPLLSTHPAPGERAAALRAALTTPSPTRPAWEIDWPAVRRAAR